MRVLASASGLRGEIQTTGDRILIAEPRFEFRDVGVFQIEVRRKGVVRAERTARQSRADVKMRGCVAMNGGTVTERNVAGSELDVGGKGVPVERLFRHPIGGGQERVEVLNLQVTGEAGGRELPAGEPGEARASAQDYWQMSGTMDGDDERLEFVEVGCAGGEVQERGGGQFPVGVDLGRVRVGVQLGEFEFVRGGAIDAANGGGQGKLTRLRIGGGGEGKPKFRILPAE